MLEWFTTIPGILIICGVILLVIAVILFVVGAKKNKNEVASDNSVMENSVSSVNSIEKPTEIPSAGEEIAMSNVDTTINSDNSEEKIENGVFEPIHIEEPVVTNFNENISTDINNESFVNPTPVINIPDDSVREEAIPSTIYGGEIPTVDFTIPEEKPVTIYGGNDPLDATQTLPKMEEHHAPYGGSYPEVRIVEPTVNNVAPTPVEETVAQMPFVEPPVVNIPVEEPTITEPSVVSIPVEEPVITEPTFVNNEVNTATEESKVEEL